MKRLLLILFLTIATTGAAMAAADSSPRVKLTTSLGEIVIALDSSRAPATVANFLTYVKDGYYDGTIFHRVIPGFMIQGGGFDAQLNRKQTRAPIANEADNGLPNLTGTVAMARTMDPHSATAQFFINVKDNDFLDHRAKTAKGWGYCVFGKVVSGMNVVRAIESVPTASKGGMRDVPKEPVVILKASVVQAK